MATTGYTFKPDFQMISDWELSERNGFSKVAEERGWTVTLDGCLFHYGRFYTIVSIENAHEAYS